MRPPYIPEPESTSENMDIYVDGATGNDITGKGTAALPYATITRAYEDVPARIDHRVRILISNSGGDFPRDVSPHFGEESGTLAFIGVGTEEEIVSTMTLTDDAALGEYGGHSYTVAGSTWTPEEFTGAWLLPTNGAASGHAVPILNNDADTLYCPYRSTVPATGDDVKIVRPSVACGVQSTTFRAQGSKGRTAAWDMSRIGLMNLRLEHGSAGSSVFHAGGQIVASFVQHVVDDGACEPIALSGEVSVNRWGFLDSTAAVEAGTGVDNIQGMAPGVSARRVTAGSSTDGVFSVYPRGAAATGYYITSLDWFVTYGSFNGAYNGWGRVGVSINAGYVGQVDLIDGMGMHDGLETYSNAIAALWNTHIRNATVGIETGNGRLLLQDVSCDSTVCDYGIDVGANGQVKVSGTTKAGLTGTVNDIIFTAPNPDVAAAWPAAGAQATDGMGASVVDPD